MVRAYNVSFGGQVQLEGQVLLPQVGHVVPGAILCHGLGSGRGAMRPTGLNLAKKGIATLVFDFRGHGRSGGIFDGGQVEDVVDAWQWLSRLDEVDSSRVAFVGHSMGARAAVLAAGSIGCPRAVVALACPPDMEDMVGIDANFDFEQWLKYEASVVEYPRAGVFPWLTGLNAVVARLWMYLRGYRLRIDWRRCFEELFTVKVSDTLQKLGGCAKLFVSSRGDKHIPYEAVMKLYENAPEPKEIIMAEGGYHSAPLMPGSLRGRWTEWVVNVLMAGS